MKKSTQLFFFSAYLICGGAHAAVDGPHPDAIDVKEIGSGNLFVTADGMSLYTYKNDATQPGTSVCVEECEEIWPPLSASPSDSAVGDWTIIARQDGSLQWAYQDKPVYTYIRDTHAGAIIGEKAGGVWDVLYEPIDTPPNLQIAASVHGQILVDLRGHSTYTGPFENCDKACLQDWRPVEAPWAAKPLNSDWSITQRDDGLLQWLFKGRALYTFDGDFNPSDANGISARGGWKIAVLEDPPAIPNWITIQETDLGPVMATPDRMTLYYLQTDWEKVRSTTCDESCVEENWNPAIAEPGTQPIGNWATRPLSDGRLQWMYLGLPVYTFKHDRMPGDTYGDKFGTGSEIRGGWGAILEESLVQKLSS